jgi:hypothetical protein
VYGFASGDPINFSDPFGLCDDGKPCPSLGRMVLDRGVKMAEKAWEKMGGKGAELLGGVLGDAATGVVENTRMSIDVTAWPVTAAFAADATAVAISPAVNLNVLITAAYVAPGRDAPATVGTTMGAGLVAGGAVTLDRRGVSGGSVSAGIGLSLPGGGALLKALGWASVSVPEKPKSP